MIHTDVQSIVNKIAEDTLGKQLVAIVQLQGQTLFLQQRIAQLEAQLETLGATPVAAAPAAPVPSTPTKEVPRASRRSSTRTARTRKS